MPEPRRSLSATPVSDRIHQDKLESPTKPALINRNDDSKKVEVKPERVVEFKLPEGPAKSEAANAAPAEKVEKTDAEKMAEFAGLPPASAVATKRFKHTFR